MKRTRPDSLGASRTLALIALGLPWAGCSNPADNAYKAEALPPANVVEGGAKPENTVAVTDKEAPAPLEGAKKVQAVAADSKVEFVGSKVTGSHAGGFKSFTAVAVVDPAKKALLDFKATIDMNSTWSDNDKLTEHLKNQDFFDVPKFPTSEFVSTQIDTKGGDAKLAGSNAMITGNLTLHGVTKQIRFPAKVEVAESGAVSLNSEFAINRKDFGIVYGGKADDLIRDEVVIKLAVKAQ